MQSGGTDDITEPSDLDKLGAKALKKNTSSLKKSKSINPDIKFIDLGLCHDRACDRYTDQERIRGIVQMHRHVWVFHRNFSPEQVVVESERHFGGLCIDVTAVGNRLS